MHVTYQRLAVSSYSGKMGTPSTFWPVLEIIEHVYLSQTVISAPPLNCLTHTNTSQCSMSTNIWYMSMEFIIYVSTNRTLPQQNIYCNYKNRITVTDIKQSHDVKWAWQRTVSLLWPYILLILPTTTVLLLQNSVSHLKTKMSCIYCINGKLLTWTSWSCTKKSALAGGWAWEFAGDIANSSSLSRVFRDEVTC
jgi:hypothetical protein